MSMNIFLIQISDLSSELGLIRLPNKFLDKMNCPIMY
jgi:hypothetical protein